MSARPPVEQSIAQLEATASALMQQGRVSEAIEAHRVLLARAPHLADAWYNLAYLERVARRFDAALVSYGEAEVRGVSGPEDVHVNRAVILSEHLGRDSDARAALEQAIAANPAFLPAWHNLGLLHEDCGDRAAARAAYARARDLDPLGGRAHARLAAIDIVEGDAAGAAARIDRLLQNSDLGADDRAELGFMLGTARDALGDHAGAFDAFVEANRTARALIPPLMRYDRDAQDRLVDDLIRTFPRNDRHAEVAGGDPPLFICGMFRSGSTLCERLLARHSRVTAGGELETIPALVRDRLQPYPHALTGFPDAALDDLRANALRETRARFPHADVLTDKRCDNVLHIGLIKTLFPEARIIHTRRNALDNILSVFFLHFDDNISYGFALDDAVHYYRSYRRVMAHWRALYGEDILDFDYDAVVRDPVAPMTQLLDFCRLDSEPACLTGQPAEGVVRTASAWQVRQPLHTRSSQRWRNYAPFIPEVIAALDGV